MGLYLMLNMLLVKYNLYYLDGDSSRAPPLP